MAALLNPYLNFDGDLSVMTFGDMGMTGDTADQVMHAQLSSPDGFVLMASDPPPGMTLTRGDNVSVSLSGDDEPELSRWFEALAEGGEVQMPLEKQMWGDVFGQTTDTFGIGWLVNIGQPG